MMVEYPTAVVACACLRLFADKPILGNAQETLSRFTIVYALKETKETGVVLIELPVAEVVDGNDSTDHLPSSF